MSESHTAHEILEREFLEIRARVLQVGAALDRLDRGAGDVASDPRLTGLRKAIDVLNNAEGDRAERIQMIFSRHYNPHWSREFGLNGSS
jgi:hypothetical protein